MSWSVLDSLLETTVTVTNVTAAASTASLYGLANYSSTSARTLKAHHTRSRRDTRTVQGRSVAVSGTVWVRSTAAVHPTDKITLADGSTPPIVAVTHYSDEDGLFGARIELGF